MKHAVRINTQSEQYAKNNYKQTNNQGMFKFISNALVERPAAAVFQPELIDSESSIPSEAQRRYAACPPQRNLGVQMWLFKALGKALAGLADKYIKLIFGNPYHLNVVLCCH